MRIRGYTGGFRENCVVHVQYSMALDMFQWRKFMHPLPVIALIIGIAMGRYPSLPQQCPLDRIKILLRD
jgi:uncharacterized membrane protein